MEIKVTARKFELNDSLKEFLEKKLARLSRFNGKISHVDVTLTQEKSGSHVEALAVVGGAQDIHAEATTDDFLTAVNRVSDKLTRQLKRQQDQRRDHQAPRLGRDIVPEETVGQD